MVHTEVPQIRRWAVIGLWLLLSGCATHALYSSDRYYDEGHHYDVPEGHMPPPGQCRIWYPDSPPGQQPPPGDCYDLRHHVPPNAILIRG
ncbi:hypothetical protein [Methylophaga sp.]|uniref:hypothetical protein n=1 Tax=Methylophaga sp. TaxID=2024840 RepID=UPI001400B31F|nr:hypothetical protein [Methylophaga sp.]MTI63364.1 hypothetical protein [Methylophaga sp.]